MKKKLPNATNPKKYLPDKAQALLSTRSQKATGGGLHRIIGLRADEKMRNSDKNRQLIEDSFNY